MSAFALREALEANDRERRRLTLLTTALSERELGEVVHGRWTVAATLAHLAYWDRFALGLLERWAAGASYETDTLPAWHDHAVNDALLDGALALPPGAAVRLAMDAAGGCCDGTATARSTWTRSRGRWGCGAVDSHNGDASDCTNHGAPDHPHQRPHLDRGFPRPPGTRTYLGDARRPCAVCVASARVSGGFRVRSVHRAPTSGAPNEGRKHT